MAFLLSPKTGGGAASYALVATFASINGATGQEYTPDAPGTVHPGDVLTWEAAATGNEISYLPAMDFTAEPVKFITAPSPYTVEAVAGATVVFIDN